MQTAKFSIFTLIYNIYRIYKIHDVYENLHNLHKLQSYNGYFCTATCYNADVFWKSRHFTKTTNFCEICKLTTHFKSLRLETLICNKEFVKFRKMRKRKKKFFFFSCEAKSSKVEKLFIEKINFPSIWSKIISSNKITVKNHPSRNHKLAASATHSR